MSVDAVSRADFDRFEPFRHPDTDTFFEETEWFADSDGIVIGVLTRDRRDDDWAFVVLGRDEQGTFRAFENEAAIAFRDEARAQLLAAMRRALSSGLKIFRQDPGL